MPAAAAAAVAEEVAWSGEAVGACGLHAASKIAGTSRAPRSGLRIMEFPFGWTDGRAQALRLDQPVFSRITQGTLHQRTGRAC